MIECVCDQKMPNPVRNDAEGIVETGTRRRPAVSAIPDRSYSSQSFKQACASVPPADQMIVGIRDIEVPLPIHREAGWSRQAG